MALSQEEIEKRVIDSYELPNNVLNAVPEPMVTVRTSTYQHGSYIKECIEGVLMQKTDFPIEFIIGEDFSTDGTREIVFEYAEKCPDIIRVFTADYNVGSKANGQRCIRAARGKYMALCEGDDYWTDPLKLQKQVNFMGENEELTGCFHACKIDYQASEREKTVRHNGKKIFDLGYYLENKIFVTTGSLLFKKQILESYPNWALNLFAGDFVLRFLMLVNGKIGYIDDVMSVYRKGVPGSWSDQKLTMEKIDREFSDKIIALTKVNEMTNYKFNKEIRNHIKFIYSRYLTRSMVHNTLMENIHLILTNLSSINTNTVKFLVKRLLKI